MRAVHVRTIERMARGCHGCGCVILSPVSVDHYENFPVASWLVPAPLRGAVVAIYRFARAADDIADEGDAPLEQRRAALRRFAGHLDAIARGATPAEGPFPALAEAIRRHELPLPPFHDLLDAFEQDLDVTRYATYADLLDYCRRSANPVGRLVLALYRADTPANLARSDAVCTGLQLTNFWQDVAVDWHKGRVYLPQEDLARFGVGEAWIGAGRTDAAWCALLAFECARARALLAQGHALARALPWRLGLELSAVLAGGERVLHRIDSVGGDVFRRRPALRWGDWALIAVQALRRFRMAGAAT
jgi:squalene synthase HpnC